MTVVVPAQDDTDMERKNDDTALSIIPTATQYQHQHKQEEEEDKTTNFLLSNHDHQNSAQNDDIAQHAEDTQHSNDIDIAQYLNRHNIILQIMLPALHVFKYLLVRSDCGDDGDDVDRTNTYNSNTSSSRSSIIGKSAIYINQNVLVTLAVYLCAGLVNSVWQDAVRDAYLTQKIQEAEDVIEAYDDYYDGDKDEDNSGYSYDFVLKSLVVFGATMIRRYDDSPPDSSSSGSSNNSYSFDSNINSSSSSNSNSESNSNDGEAELNPFGSYVLTSDGLAGFLLAFPVGEYFDKQSAHNRAAMLEKFGHVSCFICFLFIIVLVAIDVDKAGVDENGLVDDETNETIWLFALFDIYFSVFTEIAGGAGMYMFLVSLPVDDSDDVSCRLMCISILYGLYFSMAWAGPLVRLCVFSSDGENWSRGHVRTVMIGIIAVTVFMSYLITLYDDDKTLRDNVNSNSAWDACNDNTTACNRQRRNCRMQCSSHDDSADAATFCMDNDVLSQPLLLLSGVEDEDQALNGGDDDGSSRSSSLCQQSARGEDDIVNSKVATAIQEQQHEVEQVVSNSRWWHRFITCEESHVYFYLLTGTTLIGFGGGLIAGK